MSETYEPTTPEDAFTFDLSTITGEDKDFITELFVKNRQKDLYYKVTYNDKENIVYIPQGWADYFTVKNGFTGGIDYEDGPEVYGYTATRDVANDEEIDTLFVGIDILKNAVEVTEEKAKEIHPKLFIYLYEVNAGLR